MECDRAGNFRAEIIEYGMKEFESGSVAVQIKVALKEIWNHEDETWEPWETYGMESYGSIFIVDKKGELLERGIKSLVSNTGWDGDFNSIASRTWKPTLCQVNIKPEVYREETTYKVAFVNHFDSVPGTMGMLDEEKVKALAARFGASTRSIASTAKANKAPTVGKPPAPPVKRQHAAATSAQAPYDDDHAPVIDPETGKPIPY